MGAQFWLWRLREIEISQHRAESTQGSEPGYKQEGRHSHVGECFLLDEFPTEQVTALLPMRAGRRAQSTDKGRRWAGCCTVEHFQSPLAFCSSWSVKIKTKPAAFFHEPIYG